MSPRTLTCAGPRGSFVWSLSVFPPPHRGWAPCPQVPSFRAMPIQPLGGLGGLPRCLPWGWGPPEGDALPDHSPSPVSCWATGRWRGARGGRCWDHRARAVLGSPPPVPSSSCSSRRWVPGCSASPGLSARPEGPCLLSWWSW